MCSSVWGGVDEGTLPLVPWGRHLLSHRHFLTWETVYRGRPPGQYQPSFLLLLLLPSRRPCPVLKVMSPLRFCRVLLHPTLVDLANQLAVEVPSSFIEDLLLSSLLFNVQDAWSALEIAMNDLTVAILGPTSPGQAIMTLDPLYFQSKRILALDSLFIWPVQSRRIWRLNLCVVVTQGKRNWTLDPLFT